MSYSSPLSHARVFLASFSCPVLRSHTGDSGSFQQKGEEDDTREAEGDVVELDGDHQAQAEADQPATVWVEGVECGEVSSVPDQADLRQQGVAGDLHHAGEQVGQRHHHHQALKTAAEVDRASHHNLENAGHN